MRKSKKCGKVQHCMTITRAILFALNKLSMHAFCQYRKITLMNLEQVMKKGLINNQSSEVALCSRQIISLAGLVAETSLNLQVRKSNYVLNF